MISALIKYSENLRLVPIQAVQFGQSYHLGEKNEEKKKGGVDNLDAWHTVSPLVQQPRCNPLWLTGLKASTN